MCVQCLHLFNIQFTSLQMLGLNGFRFDENMSCQRDLCILIFHFCFDFQHTKKTTLCYLVLPLKLMAKSSSCRDYKTAFSYLEKIIKIANCD